MHAEIDVYYINISVADVSNQVVMKAFRGVVLLIDIGEWVSSNKL